MVCCGDIGEFGMNPAASAHTFSPTIFGRYFAGNMAEIFRSSTIIRATDAPAVLFVHSLCTV